MNSSQLYHIMGAYCFCGIIFIMLQLTCWWRGVLSNKVSAIYFTFIGAILLEVYQGVFQHFYLVDTIFDIIADLIGIMIFVIVIFAYEYRNR